MKDAINRLEEALNPNYNYIMTPESDIRDRLARAEQNIENHRQNFTAFKSEDFGSLKREVHDMRSELNDKIDTLLDKVGAINITLAKWAGAIAIIGLVGKFLLDRVA